MTPLHLFMCQNMQTSADAQTTQPADAPQAWTDERLSASIKRAFTNYGIEMLARRVRDDTAAERDAYWQARVDQVEDTWEAAHDRVETEMASLDIRQSKRIDEYQRICDSLREDNALYDRELKAHKQRIAELEADRDKWKTHADRWHAAWYEWHNTFGSIHNAEQAAQLWRLWQAFAAVANEDRNGLILYLNLEVGAQDISGNPAGYWGTWHEATVRLKEQAANPVSVEELTGRLQELNNFWCESSLQDLIERLREYGIKPAEDPTP